MATAPGDTTTHPVADFTRRAHARLDDLHTSASRPVWAMTPEELRETLLGLAGVEAQVTALRLEVLAEAERRGACTEAGERTAADWVAHQTRQRRPHARADLHLAQALDERHRQLQDALASGALNVDQARTISHALDDLPTTGPDAVTPEQRASAEAFLIDHATRHDARDLAVLGRRLHEVIAPEQADAREGRALAADEHRAAQRMSFEMREHPDGTCHGRFRLPTLHGAMLAKALQSLMSPARPTPPAPPVEPSSSVEPVETTPPHTRRPYATRRGEAFAELIERLPVRDLPTAGGGDATVVVTMTLDQLLGRLTDAGVATLDTGHRISAAEARRLAARHRLVPMVLGGASQVLDHGTTQRLFTKAQRLALAQTQSGCTAEHCDTPPAMCHAHHDRPWSADGPTDLTNGRLLCAHHHRRIHDPSYETRRLPDGKIAFHRRT